MDFTFYLQSGQQTQIVKRIMDIVASFDTSSLDLDIVFKILEWVHQNIKQQFENEYKSKVFRKRTADEIIQSGFATGCTDYALVFITLSRAKGIPAKYVEAVSQGWLDQGDSEHLRGHVFSEVFINNKWRIVDPQGAVIKAWYGKRFKILAEGLDSWDIDVSNLDSLRDKFIAFRQAYDTNHLKGRCL